MRDDAPFDIDAFLAQPHVARVATAGPTIRPVWYLWEDGAFWWLTGPWSRLVDRLLSDPEVALVVDTCDLTTGDVRQVTATGTADVHDYDTDRATRLLRRYLGTDERSWDRRFQPHETDAGTVFVRLTPTHVTARDLSFEVPGADG